MLFVCYNCYGDNMDIVLRRYSDYYLDAVDKIIFDSFGYHKERVVDNRTIEFVVCIGDRAVGYFNIFEEIDVVRNIKILHLGYVCIDLEYRGRGIGRAVIKYTINYAKENGFYRLELTSKNNRYVAHKLYRELGFVKRDSSIFRKEFI